MRKRNKRHVDKRVHIETKFQDIDLNSIKLSVILSSFFSKVSFFFLHIFSFAKHYNFTIDKM